MRLLKSLTLVVAVALMVTACGGGGGETPSTVAKKCIEATMEFDFVKAKQYVSKEYQAATDKLIDKFNKPELKEWIEQTRSAMKDTPIEVINEKIDGNNATVTVKFSIMGRENKKDISLIKEDGSWKINEEPGL